MVKLSGGYELLFFGPEKAKSASNKVRHLIGLQHFVNCFSKCLVLLIALILLSFIVSPKILCLVGLNGQLWVLRKRDLNTLARIWALSLSE